MSEYIKREDAIKATGGRFRVPLEAVPAANVVELEPGTIILTDFEGNTIKVKDFDREEVKRANVDLVKVVRCKDCQSYLNGICYAHQRLTRWDDYCSQGIME